MQKSKWDETVLIVDADYLDRVAFDLIVNFERMIGRAIPAGDLCRWIDCVALDGGLRPGNNSTQVVFIHSKGKSTLENFMPSNFSSDIDGKAFKDNLGEFCMLAFPVEEIISPEDFFTQSLEMLADSTDVKRLIVVGDMAHIGDRIKRICARTDGKDITLLTMEPTPGRGFSQEILGYSLMSALGISAEEFGD